MNISAFWTGDRERDADVENGVSREERCAVASLCFLPEKRPEYQKVRERNTHHPGKEGRIARLSGGDGNEMISSVTTRTLSGPRWGQAEYVRLAAAQSCAFDSDDATQRGSQKRLQSFGGGRRPICIFLAERACVVDGSAYRGRIAKQQDNDANSTT